MNHETIIEAVKACVRKANKLFDVKIPLDLSVSFITGDVIGYGWWNPCRPADKRFGIQFNKFVSKTQPDLVVRVVIPHEVAHLVMYYKQEVQGLIPNATDHSAEWADICKALGGVNSQFVRAFTFVPGLRRDSIYHKVITESNFVVYITKFRYNQIQNGKQFKIPHTLELIGKKNVSRVPIKRSQLISERKLCYIHHLIQV